MAQSNRWRGMRKRLKPEGVETAAIVLTSEASKVYLTHWADFRSKCATAFCIGRTFMRQERQWPTKREGSPGSEPEPSLKKSDCASVTVQRLTQTIGPLTGDACVSFGSRCPHTSNRRRSRSVVLCGFWRNLCAPGTQGEIVSTQMFRLRLWR